MAATTAASSLLFTENELRKRPTNESGHESDSDESTSSSLPVSNSGSVEMDQHFANEDKDFLWTLTEEPHRSRRMQIMKDYPQVCCCPGPSMLAVLTVVIRSPS